ncbi:MAG: Gfo/Idh/MocA family oxidoreductase [Pseudomonadota bacterium]
MSQPNQINVAVIGCGHWGKNLARNFHELNALKAVHDIHPERAQAVATLHGVDSKSQEAIYADPQIAAIVVAVPSQSHYLVAKQALMADKHVFVEKPLTLDYTKAEQLVTLAKKRGRILMVGHLLQYHPAYQELKRLVQNNTIGPLKAIYANRVSFGPVRMHENCLWDLAPHDFSMVLSLVNSPVANVSAFAQDHLIPNLPDTVTTNISFANGVKARVFNSWFYPNKEQKFMAIGEKGALIFDDTQPWNKKLIHIPHSSQQTRKGIDLTQDGNIFVTLTPAEPLKSECAHLIRCMENDKKPLTHAENAIVVMDLLQRSQNSIDCNQSKKQVEENSSKIENSHTRAESKC